MPPSKPRRDETYVERIERELSAWIALMRRKRALGLAVLTAVLAYSLHVLGVFQVAWPLVSTTSEPTRFSSRPAGNEALPPSTDTFAFTNGPVPNGTWARYGTRGFLVDGGRLRVSPGPEQYVVSAPVDLPTMYDQFSMAAVDAPRHSNSSWIGVACRISSLGYYGYGVSGTSRELYKIVGGKHYSISVKDGQQEEREYNSSLLRLECQGTQLRATLDGEIDFLETDSALPSGKPGVTGYAYPLHSWTKPETDIGTNYLSAWNGGPLVLSTATPR